LAVTRHWARRPVTNTITERERMGNLRKKRRKKIAKHKRKKRMKLLRHKKKLS
jgi:hypothetical protein